MIHAINAEKACSYLYFYENGVRYCTQSCSIITNYNDGSYDWRPDLPITYTSNMDNYQSITKCNFNYGWFSDNTTCGSVDAYYDIRTGYITQFEGPTFSYNGIVYPM